MSALAGENVEEILLDLEEEEKRIFAELAQLNGASPPENSAPSRPHRVAPGKARETLNALLIECEKEVRNAKGYIAPGSSPIRIVRVVPGGSKPPKTATFLSRPKGTGVDFTVPVTLKEYLDAIKSPIFLNDIREKCTKGAYTSAEEYVDDMRLLARNTATFNNAADLDWVVQHARLLLEAAEDAVGARREAFVKAEAALRAEMAPPPATGKRRRSKAPTSAPAPTASRGSDTPPPPPTAASQTISSNSVTAGTKLFVLWAQDMTWYSAKVIKKFSVHRAEVEYDDDRTRQNIDLRVDKWLPMEKGRSEGPPMKRRKGTGSAFASGSTQAGASGTGVTAGVSRAELDEVAESISSAVETARLSLLDEINARFDKLERAVNRDDHMRRVLLAVNDISENVSVWMREVQTSINELHTRVPVEEADNDVDGVGEGDTVAGLTEVDTEGAGSGTFKRTSAGDAKPSQGGSAEAPGKAGKDDDAGASGENGGSASPANLSAAGEQKSGAGEGAASLDAEKGTGTSAKAKKSPVGSKDAGDDDVMDATKTSEDLDKDKPERGSVNDAEGMAIDPAADRDGQDVGDDARSGMSDGSHRVADVEVESDGGSKGARLDIDAPDPKGDNSDASSGESDVPDAKDKASTGKKSSSSSALAGAEDLSAKDDEPQLVRSAEKHPSREGNDGGEATNREGGEEPDELNSKDAGTKGERESGKKARHVGHYDEDEVEEESGKIVDGKHRTDTGKSEGPVHSKSTDAKETGRHGDPDESMDDADAETPKRGEESAVPEKSSGRAGKEEGSDEGSGSDDDDSSDEGEDDGDEEDVGAKRDGSDSRANKTASARNDDSDDDSREAGDASRAVRDREGDSEISKGKAGAKDDSDSDSDSPARKEESGRPAGEKSGAAEAKDAESGDESGESRDSDAMDTDA